MEGVEGVEDVEGVVALPRQSLFSPSGALSALRALLDACVCRLRKRMSRSTTILL